MPVSTRLSTALERKVSYTTDGSYAPSEFGSASHNSSLGEIPELEEPEEYQDTHGRFPIFQYIKKSTLPDFIALGKPSLHQCKAMGHAFQWAKYRGLVLNAGTRSLREVQRIPGWGTVVQIRHTLAPYTPHNFALQGLMEGEPYGLQFRLPAENLIVFDDIDIQFLSEIRNEDDLILAFKRYVLDTASEAWRFMSRIPTGTPLAESLKFKFLNRLCPAHHGRWDILGLPPNPSSMDELPLAIIFIHPWEFGLKDFRMLTAEQHFHHGALDLLTTKEHIASDTVWAVVYEVCKNRGRKFIVTSYNYWAFGIFNKDYTQASITDIHEASLTNFEGVSVPVGIQTGANVFEMLLLWMSLREDHDAN